MTLSIDNDLHVFDWHFFPDNRLLGSRLSWISMWTSSYILPGPGFWNTTWTLTQCLPIVRGCLCCGGCWSQRIHQFRQCRWCRRGAASTRIRSDRFLRWILWRAARSACDAATSWDTGSRHPGWRRCRDQSVMGPGHGSCPRTGHQHGAWFVCRGWYLFS